MKGKFEIKFDELYNSEHEPLGVSLHVDADINSKRDEDCVVSICAVRELMKCLKMSPMEVSMLLFSIKEDCWPDGGTLELGGTDNACGR